MKNCHECCVLSAEPKHAQALPAEIPTQHSVLSTQSCRARLRRRGFTLIELLVVMAVVALLLSIAAPRYFNHVEKAKENSLRQSLAVMRDALDKYEADLGTPANSLEDLLARSYLRQIPEDPYTGRRDTWVLIPPPDGSGNSVFDIHSPAEGTAADGTPLGEL